MNLDFDPDAANAFSLTPNFLPPLDPVEYDWDAPAPDAHDTETPLLELTALPEEKEFAVDAAATVSLSPLPILCNTEALPEIVRPIHTTGFQTSLRDYAWNRGEEVAHTLATDSRWDAVCKTIRSIKDEAFLISLHLARLNVTWIYQLQFVMQSLRRTAFVALAVVRNELFHEAFFTTMRPLQPGAQVFTFPPSAELFVRRIQYQFPLPGCSKWPVEACVAFAVLFGCDYLTQCVDGGRSFNRMALYDPDTGTVRTFSNALAYLVHRMRCAFSGHNRAPILRDSKGINLTGCSANAPCAPDMALEPLLFHRVDGVLPYQSKECGSRTTAVSHACPTELFGVHYIHPLNNNTACANHREALTQGALVNRGQRGYSRPDPMLLCPALGSTAVEAVKRMGVVVDEKLAHQLSFITKV